MAVQVKTFYEEEKLNEWLVDRNSEITVKDVKFERIPPNSVQFMVVYEISLAHMRRFQG